MGTCGGTNESSSLRNVKEAWTEGTGAEETGPRINLGDSRKASQAAVIAEGTLQDRGVSTRDRQGRAIQSRD